MRTPLRTLSLLPSVLALALLAGCGADRGRDLPEGWTLAGRSDRITPLLARLERMENTPIADEATALRARISGCERFVAECPPSTPPADDEEGAREETSCHVGEVARCVDALPTWVSGEAERPGGWALAHRAASGRWMVVRGGDEGDAASTVLTAEAGPVGIDDAAALLLPSTDPPGLAKLSDSTALVHVRVRPDSGLDLARFVAGEGWGARMYRLRSDLFEGKALAGVWELAVYPPSENDLIAPMALAVDVKEGETDLATQAMEQFLADLGEVWPVSRSDYRLGDRPGACLGNVRVMPDLSPCYVTTPDALVIGWNPKSLEVALGSDRAGDHALAGSAGLDLPGSGGRAYVARFPAADRVIASNTGAPAPVDPGSYPWGLVEITGQRDGGRYRFEVRLGPGERP